MRLRWRSCRCPRLRLRLCDGRGGGQAQHGDRQAGERCVLHDVHPVCRVIEKRRHSSNSDRCCFLHPYKQPPCQFRFGCGSIRLLQGQADDRSCVFFLPHRCGKACAVAAEIDAAANAAGRVAQVLRFDNRRHDCCAVRTTDLRNLGPGFPPYRSCGLCWVAHWLPNGHFLLAQSVVAPPEPPAGNNSYAHSNCI